MINDLYEPIKPISDINQQRINEAVKNNADFDREFVWIAIRQDLRDKVNARWASVAQYCESNFVTEFRKKGSYSSRLWELNLRHLLLNELTRKPNLGEPDLIAKKFLVECVVPDPSGVPDLIFGFTEHQYPTDEIGRRVTAALKAKLEQLNRRLSKQTTQIDYSKTPYVIAIGLPQREFRSAMSMSGMDIVETVLIGAGPLQLTMYNDGRRGKLAVSSRSTMESINGTGYEIGYFQRDEWRGVSAVLWSSEWLPDAEDIRIMLNPNAQVPLSPSDLGVDVDIITYTKTDRGYSRNKSLS